MKIFFKEKNKIKPSSELALKPLGLLYIICENFNDGDTISPQIMSQFCIDSVGAIQNALNELEDLGYIFRYKKRLNNSRFDEHELFVSTSANIKDFVKSEVI